MCAGTDLRQHAFDFGDVFGAARITGIDDMQQQRGFARFGQRGLEGGHQFVRQIADETHGVGDHHLRSAGKCQPAHRGIERREQLVGHVGLFTREAAKQRRLAGVGVADQRDRGHGNRNARAAAGLTLLLEFLQTLREHLHPLAQQSAIGLELRFARTAQADAAAALAFKVGPAAHQPAGDVLQLRELDLQLAFVTRRALREDIEDEAVAIQHAPADELLEVALLARRQRMIDEDDIGLVRLGFEADLLRLAAADEVARDRAGRDDR